MNKIIPLLSIAVLVAVSFMVIVYFEPESFGLTKPYTRVGSYDGTASKMALMISEQCLDQEENPFKDYAFARTSNGEYYIDNVICERINVHQGGCLEPFSKGYPDETCKNRVTFDFPYGEKGTPINKEFCNQVESERSPDDSEHNKTMIDEYVNICTIRGLIDSEPEPSDFYPRYNVSIFHNAKTMGQYMTNDFITIGPYSHVTWSNYDDVSVTINSKGSDEKWSTDEILPQGYATVTFNKTGIYEYTGNYGLNGVIVVMDGGGELLSSKFSDVFGNGSPLMYTEGLEPVLLYDNCKRYAYWLTEHGKEKIDLSEGYSRYPPWGNQVFPLVDFCITNGDLVKTISGDHYRWEFQFENEN